jgi:hypothetical protein
LTQTVATVDCDIAIHCGNRLGLGGLDFQGTNFCIGPFSSIGDIFKETSGREFENFPCKTNSVFEIAGFFMYILDNVLD